MSHANECQAKPIETVFMSPEAYYSVITVQFYISKKLSYQQCNVTTLGKISQYTETKVIKRADTFVRQCREMRGVSTDICVGTVCWSTHCKVLVKVCLQHSVQQHSSCID